MLLETERLILRPWEEADAEGLYEYARHPLLGPAAGWPVHTSVANSLEIIRDVLAAPETYALTLKGETRPIGSLGLMTGNASNLNIPDDEAELGYWLAVPFWGRGLIPEAARALLRRAFEDLSLAALWCGYFEGNEQSKRVAEKCGFTWQYTETKKWPLTGELKTQHITRLMEKEWAGR